MRKTILRSRNVYLYSDMAIPSAIYSPGKDIENRLRHNFHVSLLQNQFGMNFLLNKHLFGRLLIALLLLVSSFSFMQGQCTIDNTCGGEYANVVIGEVSGDSSQSDGCEDAIVEIIGPPGTNIGCMVVTDTEWAVLIPPGSVIPADGVFFIGCSASMNNNCGVGNPSMSGLIGGSATGCEGGGNEGDFNAGLLSEFDFDTCDPNNTGFYDPAATGFTLDNPGTQSSNGDGEQVFLFLPDGTAWDGIVWDGGGTGAADHASVSLYGNPYTLGDNDGNGVVNDNAGTVPGGRGDGGNATAVPILPTDVGCPCNTPSAPGTFTVPPISDPVWYAYTDGDHVGCNSSFVRGPIGGMGSGGNPSHTDGLITSTSTDAAGQPLDNGGGLASGTTGDTFTPGAYTPSSCGDPSAEWGYTDNPTPGQPNNDPAFVFYADVTQICSVTDPVTFTVEIYNYQQVSDGSVDFSLGGSSGCANGETGSLVDFNGVQQSYDTYTINGEQTTMTVTISNWNVGTNTVGLVWDNWSNTNGTSGNPATQTNPNECYEEFVYNIEVAEPLIVNDAQIDCDAGDSVPGTINVNNFISGGAGNTYDLYSDNPPVTLVSSNTSGVFLLPTDMTVPNSEYVVVVTDGSGCSMPVMLTINDNCELPPVCPSNLVNTGTTPDAEVCPGDIVELCLDGDDLPAGGTICWYETTDGTDPITEDATTATATISAAATEIGCIDIPTGPSPPMGGPVINEVLYDPDGADGNTACEAVEIAGTPGTDLSCHMISDGDFVIVFPVGTVIPPDGYLVIASGGCDDMPPEYALSDIDINTSTCNCTNGTGASFNLTNTGEFMSFFDASGALIDGIIFEETANGDNNGPNGQTPTIVNPPGCTNAGFMVPAVPDYDNPPAPWAFSSGASDSSIERDVDITGGWQADDGTGNTIGGPNAGIVMMPPECLMYAIPDLCAESPATITIEPLISPIDPNCVDGDFMFVGATSTFTIDCPLAEIASSSIDVCLADQATVDIPVTITGGTGPYALTYDDGSGPTTINGFAAGGNISIAGPTNGKITITLVSIIDEGGAMCNGAVNDSEFCVNIRPQETLTITSSSLPTTCEPCDGTITFDISGGGTSANSFDIDYTIGGVINSIASVSMPYTLTGACPGIYDIASVLDDNGCPMLVESNEQELIAPAGIPISVTMQPMSICASNGGSVDLTTDATYDPPYDAASFTFFDTNPATLPAGALTNSPPLLPSTVVSPTGTTTYWVLYVDPITGCESVTAITVTVITEAAVCMASNSGACPGDPLSLSETGGDAVSWSWSGPAGAVFDDTAIASPTVTPAVAGTYSVTVTNADGCTAECTTELVLDGPTCSVDTTTDTTCGESNGSATVGAIDGNPPYTFSWSNGATGGSVSDLAPGNYEITVTDANGCTSTCETTIDASTSPTCSVDTTTDTTCGESNGSATVGAVDGTPPYMYVWSNGANGVSVTDLAAGIYEITVTDSNGCTSTCEATIDASTSPTCSVDTTTDTTCGESDGSATVGAVDGTPPYTFSWSNGDTGGSVSDLAAGMYEITVTDSNGCTSTCDVTIDASDAPTCSVDTTTDTTCGESNGSATVGAVDGTPPYSFSWSNGATGGSVSDLAPGNYEITVTDSNGCTSTCEATIDASTSPTCSIDNFSDESCVGGDGSATVSALDGIPPYTYTWNNGETSSSINGLTAGLYTVTVTDALGCTGECSIIIVADTACEFDLALDKVLNTNKTPGPFSIGSEVVYTICVYNQGQIDATNTQVTDYGSVDPQSLISPVLPATGCPYPTTTASGATVAVSTIGTQSFEIDNLAAGDFVCIDILYTVGPDAISPIVNNAEITMDSGDDDDSTPNDNSGNDPELDTDNDTADDPDNPLDEDDFDPEIITLQLCPMVMGDVVTPEEICEGELFDITFNDLSKFAFVLNEIQDFGLDIVYFQNGPPGDPYVGGTSIGMLVYGDLDGDPLTTQSGTLSDVTLAPGTYTICAILDPVPTALDMCTPSTCAEITINENPTISPELPPAVCAGELITINGNPSAGSNIVSHDWVITDDGGADGVTITNNMDGTLTLDASGLSQTAIGSFTIVLSYSVVDENGCQSETTEVEIILSQPSCGVFAWDGR